MNNQIMLNRELRNDYFYNEAIKTLRTNIQFSGANVRAIMLTSSMPDEGKSETSFAIASSLAQLDNKVLFIDADVRKSVFASRYHLDRKVDGLSQYLCGQKSLEEVLYHTNVPNLDMIFSGPLSPNPAELLEDSTFEQLVSWAKLQYNYVIIDTPPIGSVIDGAIVAKQCDGAIIVIKSGYISYKLLQKVKNQLERTGCRILGTVLNRVDMKEQGYYRHYGKYEKYYRYEASDTESQD